jgi:hypothetical protein
MTQTTSLPVPTGFAADTWFGAVANSLRCRHEFGLGDTQDTVAQTALQAMQSVVGPCQLLWVGMVPDGSQFVGALLDEDGDERAFAMSDSNGRWVADVTCTEFRLPVGYEAALAAVTEAPHESALAVNPGYVPAALEWAAAYSA